MRLLFLGSSKSSFFFISLSENSKERVILTDHPSQFGQIIDYHKSDKVISFEQTSDVKAVEYLILSATKEDPVLITASTTPERGKEWLDRLLANTKIAKKIKDSPGHVSFLLPHSPNQHHESFENTGCQVIQLDYYPGIGGYRAVDEKTAKVEAGAKELIYYTVANSEPLVGENMHNILNQVQIFCPAANLIELDHPDQISLPTNAFLHVCGIVSYVVEQLALQGKVDKSIIQCETIEDFCAALESINNDVIEDFVNNDTSLVNKGFYKGIPTFGVYPLMEGLSASCCKIRAGLIDAGHYKSSFLDKKNIINKFPKCHPFHHLMDKYRSQYYHKHHVTPNQVSFDEFLHSNPAYQNDLIVFPTNSEGNINTDHRFLTEDLETIVKLQKEASDLGMGEEVKILSSVVGFCVKLQKLHVKNKPGSSIKNPEAKKATLGEHNESLGRSKL
ncbi:MAG: hypothetical protein ACJAW3_000740 [Lentimonas sp.]|jgi:hypothetical protein